MYMFRKTHITVKTAIAKMTDIEKQHFAITYNGSTLVEHTDIISCLLQKYSTFELIHSNDTNEILSTWDNFKARYSHGFKRMYDALTAEYNPIENYDKYSDISNTGTTSATSSADNTAMATTEDSANWNNTDKTTATASTSGNTSANTIEHTHGNIGVMTAGQMISDTIALRTTNNLCDIICGMYYDMEMV